MDISKKFEMYMEYDDIIKKFKENSIYKKIQLYKQRRKKLSDDILKFYNKKSIIEFNENKFYIVEGSKTEKFTFIFIKKLLKKYINDEELYNKIILDFENQSKKTERLFLKRYKEKIEKNNKNKIQL